MPGAIHLVQLAVEHLSIDQGGVLPLLLSEAYAQLPLGLKMERSYRYICTRRASGMRFGPALSFTLHGKSFGIGKTWTTCVVSFSSSQFPIFCVILFHPRRNHLFQSRRGEKGGKHCTSVRVCFMDP